MPKLYRLATTDRAAYADRFAGSYVTAVVDDRGQRDPELVTGRLVAVARTNVGTVSLVAVIEDPRPGWRSQALSLATVAELRPATNAELVAAGNLEVLEGRQLAERSAILAEADRLEGVPALRDVEHVERLRDEVARVKALQVDAARAAAGMVRG